MDNPSTPNFSQLKNQIDNSNKVVIVMHKSPDGDAIGSSLALANVLEKLNKTVVVIAPNEYPENLQWLKGNHLVVNNYNQKDKVKEAFVDADIVFCLDFNEPSRAWGVEPLINAFKGYIAMIDHHQEPADFAQFVYSDTKASSTCEMIYHTLEALELSHLIDKEVGQCIYLGMVTDTGSFRFKSTSSTTLMVAAKLMELGVNHVEIYERVFDESPLDRLRLTGYALSQKLEVFEEFGVALISLTQAELQKFNFQPGFTEGLVNYGLSVRGVNLACLMTEKEGQIRLSFRSLGKFSVNDFSRGHFNGGGHINAAGGISNLSMEKTRENFIKLLPFYKNQILDSCK
jgi:phosphoesterase RecJ-like protein